MIQKLIILLLIITSLGQPRKVSDFTPGFFKPSLEVGFKSVDTGEQKVGQVMAFADIDGDHYTDYVAVPNKTLSTIYVYFWDQHASEFTRDEFNVSKSNFKNIEQILVSDINYENGKNEIVVVYKMPDNTFQLEIFTVFDCAATPNGDCFEYTLWNTNADLFKGMTSVPFLLDRKGDGRVQIFSIEGTQRYVSSLSDNGSFNKKGFGTVLQNSPDSFNAIDKHFASVIDFNGDCESDLFLLSKKNNVSQFEFYYKTPSASYVLQNASITFNSTIIFATFIDIDASGTADLILVADDESANRKILVNYNLNTATKLCVEFTDSIPYNLSQFQQLQIGKEGIVPKNTVHFGQVNHDGYPDLMAIFREPDGSNKAYLLINALNTTTEKRTFVENDYTASISAPINPVQASFFDYAEDGRLDILLTLNQSQDQNGATVNHVIRESYINNLKEDTLFIKIVPLSPTSSYISGSTNISSAFGVTIQWVITLLDGSRKIQTLNQKSQANYGALQLPFALGGLGRTNNYIEDLTVGYEGESNINSWTPIIPNSQLMVYRQGDEWKLQTLLTDNDRVYQVIYISIAILAVLAIVIVFLNYRESQEDKKNHYNVIQLIR